MADISPTWSEIANKWSEILSASFRVFYPYPENAIDSNELPCVVINEPQTTTYTPFTYGAFELVYAGELSLLVKAVDTGQARLYANDIAEIEAFTLGVLLVCHANRQIKDYAASIAFGAATTARFSPYDGDTRGHYAGKSIPYTIKMQFRS